jgi:hypothetical protein
MTSEKVKLEDEKEKLVSELEYIRKFLAEKGIVIE